MRGFSFASVVLSYFMVAGGLFTGMLALSYIHATNEYMGYAMMAAGAFVGGFFAARASRGSTIVEPAIGGLAVIGTIVGLLAGTDVGHMLWAQAHDQTVKAIALFSLSTSIGAGAGAYIGEAFFGEATLSTVPWFLYSALATFGSCLMVTLIGALIVVGHHGGETSASADAIGKALIGGMAGGCVIAGIAIGASARVRPLVAAMLGGGAGGAAYGLLISQTESGHESQLAGVLVVLAGGAAILTLIGTAIGWAAVGKRAGAAA